MAPRPINLTTDPLRVSAVRTVTGSPVASDPTSLVDANFPEISVTLAGAGGAIMCRGLATLWIGVELTGGASPSVVLDMLFRDTDAADGQRWHRLLFGSSPAVVRPTLDGTGFVEVTVNGSVVYPRLHTVTGNPTGVVILARPGAALNGGKGLFQG